MIKAILFDFDYTLGDREKYAYECYKTILSKHTDASDPVAFEAVLQDCMIWDQQGDVNKKYLKDKLREVYGIELPYEDFNTYWDSQLWQYCVLYPDSENVLRELGKKYKLGIITNGPADGQMKKLQKSGAYRYFGENAVTISGACGLKKPDPEIFRYACRRLGVLPQESVYVGDLYQKDILGALKSGMEAVWICRNSSGINSTGQKVIHRISELLEMY